MNRRESRMQLAAPLPRRSQAFYWHVGLPPALASGTGLQCAINATCHISGRSNKRDQLRTFESSKCSSATCQ
jgi:hypothetical protein